MPGRKRMTLNLPGEQAADLKRLQQKAGYDTVAETIRAALDLYEWYLTEQQNNSKIQVERADGSVRIVEFMRRH